MSNTYTTCPTCDELLTIADRHLPVHPNCDVPYLLEVEQQLRAAARAGDLETFDRLAPIVDAPRKKPSLPRSAELYASWGWPVFPLRAGTKVPATAHGVDDAVTDSEQVGEWWRRNPNYNIGLATGHYFDVIDVDTPKKDRPNAVTGYLALADLDEQGALPASHALALTPSGGRHLYVLPSPEGKNDAGLAPGIDYRALGGYVVAAPSVIDSKRYQWLTVPSPAIKRGNEAYQWMAAK